MGVLSKYRSDLDGAYDRHGYGAINVVGRWWMLCQLPILFVTPNSPLGLAVFGLLGSLMLAGIIYTGWHLWGISIRRSNAKAQKLEDEE